jgi:hypothetical protein
VCQIIRTRMCQLISKTTVLLGASSILFMMMRRHLRRSTRYLSRWNCRGEPRRPAVNGSYLLISGKPIIHNLVNFFCGVISVFLLAVLAKTGGRAWFFDGEFVVECWSNVVL